jgi:hypothetical protein
VNFHSSIAYKYGLGPQAYKYANTIHAAGGLAAWPVGGNIANIEKKASSPLQPS